MRPIASARRIVFLLLLGGGAALAQSALPPTSPTALPPPAASIAPPPAEPSQPPPRHAQVVFAHGQLEVTADNSSLNQILRDIGSQTGMKITGGVADERVFGKYGPAAPAQVLASLIDGTGSNMLLRDTASNVPAELILTPQGGGPTPPNPTAPATGTTIPPISPSRLCTSSRSRLVPPISLRLLLPPPSPTSPMRQASPANRPRAPIQRRRTASKPRSRSTSSCNACSNRSRNPSNPTVRYAAHPWYPGFPLPVSPQPEGPARV